MEKRIFKEFDQNMQDYVDANDLRNRFIRWEKSSKEDILQLIQLIEYGEANITHINMTGKLN